MIRRPPAFWQQPRHPAAWALMPAACVWQTVTMLRRRFTPGRKTPIPSICIGNVTAGGAGKTPTALHVAELLRAEGCVPAFATRGYGAAPPAPCLRVAPETHKASEVGDEALLLAATAPCYVSANRLQAAQAAANDGATHIIYDDGLQNPAIAYDRALLVIDGPTGVGNGKIIPAGPLREPLAAAAARAAAIVMIGADRQNLTPALGKPVFTAALEPDLSAIPPGQNWVAFAGIGRPEKFFAACRENGLHLAGARGFPDHHAFTAADLVNLDQAAMENQARLITTAKDAARLSPAWQSRVTILPVALRLDNPAALLQLLL